MPEQKGNDFPEIYEYYQERKLLSMRNYRRALIKPKSGKLDPRAEFVPGDAYIEEKYFRLNNTYCFLYFLKDYTSRDRRSLYTFSKKTVDGGSVKVKSYLFEKYIAKYGLQKTIQFINENNLKIQKKE